MSRLKSHDAMRSSDRSMSVAAALDRARPTGWLKIARTRPTFPLKWDDGPSLARSAAPSKRDRLLGCNRHDVMGFQFMATKSPPVRERDETAPGVNRQTAMRAGSGATPIPTYCQALGVTYSRPPHHSIFRPSTDTAPARRPDPHTNDLYDTSPATPLHTSVSHRPRPTVVGKIHIPRNIPVSEDESLVGRQLDIGAELQTRPSSYTSAARTTGTTSST